MSCSPRHASASLKEMGNVRVRTQRGFNLSPEIKELSSTFNLSQAHAQIGFQLNFYHEGRKPSSEAPP